MTDIRSLDIPGLTIEKIVNFHDKMSVVNNNNRGVLDGNSSAICVILSEVAELKDKISQLEQTVKELQNKEV